MNKILFVLLNAIQWFTVAQFIPNTDANIGNINSTDWEIYNPLQINTLESYCYSISNIKKFDLLCKYHLLIWVGIALLWLTLLFLIKGKDISKLKIIPIFSIIALIIWVLSYSWSKKEVKRINQNNVIEYRWDDNANCREKTENPLEWTRCEYSFESWYCNESNDCKWSEYCEKYEESPKGYEWFCVKEKKNWEKYATYIELIWWKK